MHILPAPDEQLWKIFADIPRIGFKNGKSLMDHIVRSVLPEKIGNLIVSCVS